MKIAKQRPEEKRTAVYVTQTEYELWQLRPILLGNIKKEGLYWFSSDGMRFVSSRDALAYLINLRESAGIGNTVTVSASSPSDSAERKKMNVRKRKTGPKPTIKLGPKPIPLSPSNRLDKRDLTPTMAPIVRELGQASLAQKNTIEILQGLLESLKLESEHTDIQE